MPIILEPAEGRPVLNVVFSGPIARSETEAYFRGWANREKLDSPVVAYVNLSGVESIDISSEHVMGHGRQMGERHQNFGDVVTEIILAEGDLMFGYARMYQMFAGDYFPVLVFREEDEAKECLAETLEKFFPKAAGE